MSENNLYIPLNVPAREEPEFLEHFLNLVKAHPCIYNTTLKEYHIPIVKENALKDIADALYEPVEQTENRWKAMKNKYNAEKNLQEREGRSGAAASTRSQWPYFNTMRNMLTNVNFERSTYSNVSNNTPAPTKCNNKQKKTPNKTDALIQNALSGVNHSLSELVSNVKSSIIKEEKPAAVVVDEESMVGNLLLDFLNRSSPKTAREASKMITNIINDAL